MYSFKHEETGHYARRNRDGTLFVGHYPGDYDDASSTIDPDERDEVPEELRRSARYALSTVLPAYADAPAVDEWLCIRGLTPDGDPVIGWTELRGLSVALFNASGIQLSPVAGHIIAHQLVDDDPTEFYDGVSITRFDGYDDWRS